MKKSIKGFILGIIITTMLMSTALGAGLKKTIEVAFNSVNLTVNGKKVQADTILYEGTTYVPLRAAGEMLGKEVGWDQKTNTASINDKGAGTQPVTANYSRTNPAPIGVKQTITVENFSETYTAEVNIKETIRGEEAWELIREANMFNSEPGADEEYILAKIYVKVNKSKDDKKVGISGHLFEVFNEGNAKYDDYFSVVEPSPQLSTELYEGAEHEGYEAFKVKKNDKNPKVCFGSNYDGTGGIWFKLNK